MGPDFFKLKEKRTSFKREVIGGITTFLTMAYIIFLHPNMLAETGMDKNALITVTCIASFLGTVLVGLWANVPFALAPGLGLNSFFTYTLVLGMGIDWQTALGVVFISGILFIILTFSGFREKIIQTIPLSLRLAVPSGIGLLIAFVGFKNMGLIISNSRTLLQIGPITQTLFISLAGFLIMIILEIRKFKAGILIGILFIFVAGLILGIIRPPESFVSLPPSIAPIAFELDIIHAFSLSLTGVIFSFLFVDLFDSVGTIIACSYEAGLVDDEGKIHNIEKILGSDAISTVLGSLMGTSTITTYIESASGIASGARTGLSSLVTGILFLTAPFFAPVISMVPGYATAPALLLVGFYMFKTIVNIKFREYEESIPAFLTIVMMPFTGSISMGLTFGFLSYIFIKLISGKVKEISMVMWIIGILATVNLLVGA